MKFIGVLGPESTGKSTLCEALASHYSTEWIPEYARKYVEQLNRSYTYNDVVAIAKYQIEQMEHVHSNEASFLFFDTELIITKVWMEHCYHKTPNWLQKAIESAPIDYYLLCAPDLPWEFDPVRENPNLRDYFFDWYKREIEQLKRPYAIIHGNGRSRIDLACQVLDQLK